MRVIGLHGFNCPDGGKASICTLYPYFEAEGFRVLHRPYGNASLADVRFANGNIAAMLAGWLEHDDVLVCHSNGALIACEAAKRVDPKTRLHLVAVNPALDADCTFPANLGFIHVYHNQGDSPTWWARLMIAHGWGHMARVGYQGAFDGRVLSIDTALSDRPVPARGHSGVFAPDAVKWWGGNIARRAVNAYTNLAGRKAAA